MTRAYSVNWLEPEHAAEVARLEAQIHTSAHRAGQQIIAGQFLETAEQGRNFSLGLYCETDLVGFALVFLASDRREMASFFAAPVPAALNPVQPVIYVADFAVLPAHRRMSTLLVQRLAHVFRQRDDLASVSVDAFSTEEYLAFWTSRSGFLSRLGLQLVGRHPFQDARLGTTMYWLSMERVSVVRDDHARAGLFTSIRSCEGREEKLAIGEISVAAENSSALAPQWDALVGLLKHPTVMQRHAYLQSWWTRAGARRDLLMLAAIRDDVAVAIAPLQRDETRWLGKRLRRLTFLDSPPEVSGVSLMTSPDDNAAIAALAAHIVTEQRDWDSIVLTGQHRDDRFVLALEARMRAARLPVSVRPGPPIDRLPIVGSWSAYLASRPLPLRERLAAAESSHSTQGTLRFETFDSSSSLSLALERFVSLAARAADERRDTLGSSSATVSFFRTLVEHHAAALGMQFGFLSKGSEDIAAVLGFTLNRVFHPVHVISDGACSGQEPGLLAMSRQLQRIFERGECDSVVLSSQGVPARTEWASERLPTVSLYGSRSTLSGWLLHATYSVGKPLLKRLVGRTSETA